jgi:transcriptional regulator with XRE-family HTH domain
MLIQKLRLKRGWSQEQLAEASGLSARTVQRIETGHPASTESLKSLAAVFEVDFSALDPEQIMTSASSSPAASAEKQEEEAFRYVRKLRRFYLHLFRYIIVVLALLAINLIVAPHRMWVFWVMGGWGLAVLMHASSVFRPAWFLGAQWERQQVERRLGRSL